MKDGRINADMTQINESGVSVCDRAFIARFLSFLSLWVFRRQELLTMLEVDG